MTFFEARERYGIPHLPDFLEEYYEEKEYTAFIDRDTLSVCLEKYGVTEGRAKLLEAFDAVEADAALRSFSGFIVLQTCAQRNRLDGEHINIKKCEALGKLSEYYPMLILLSCAPISERRCRERGLPEESYTPIPERALGGILRAYEKRGRVRVDFPWQVNHVTCSLFQFGRFYFVPHRFDADFDILKNKTDGRVIALLPAGEKIRPEDGQYDGIEGVFSPDAFETVRRDSDTEYIGNPIHPRGKGMSRVITLPKSEWEQTVFEGDCFLALHIPGGPGYDPENFREACLEALAFYERYFPELSVRGIWSESWLYDVHLRELLPEDSGIIRMQDQMYIAPFPYGHASIHGELHHREPPSSLERAVVEYEKRGGTFSSEFMFILTEDTDRIGGGKVYEYEV